MKSSMMKLLSPSLVLLFSTNLLGKSRDFKDLTASASLTTSYSLNTTYKSELIASNDTGSGFRYSLGGYAGKNGILGFFLRTDSSTTTFELNSSSNTVVWQDSILRYRWSYLYIGIMYTTMTYEVSDQGTDIINAAATGLGANFGFLIPLGNGSIYLDAASVTPSTTVNSLTQEVSVGARSEYDLGASIDISQKLVDFILGYRQQQYTVTTDSAYTELVLSTYLGFRFSLYF